jgi:anti-sigma factor RsiW
MKVDHRCRWVRHRLPLLAGGELGIEERRRVERHLIGCPGCRDQRDASSDALTALRSFAEESPTLADAPSLWPALAVQIRESRHVGSRLPWWEIPLTRPWMAFSVVVGIGVVLASAFRQAPVQVQVQDKAVPSRVITKKPAPAKPPVLAVSPPRALPTGPPRPPGALPKGGDSPVVSQSSLLFNYDLDHMTPMNPSNRDPQRSY